MKLRKARFSFVVKNGDSRFSSRSSGRSNASRYLVYSLSIRSSLCLKKIGFMYSLTSSSFNIHSTCWFTKATERMRSSCWLVGIWELELSFEIIECVSAKEIEFASASISALTSSLAVFFMSASLVRCGFDTRSLSLGRLLSLITFFKSPSTVMLVRFLKYSAILLSSVQISTCFSSELCSRKKSIDATMQASLKPLSLFSSNGDS